MKQLEPDTDEYGELTEDAAVEPDNPRMVPVQRLAAPDGDVYIVWGVTPRVVSLEDKHCTCDAPDGVACSHKRNVARALNESLLEVSSS